MLPYLELDGKPEKSNPGKKLITFNRIFIFVLSESKGFPLEPSPSLVQSSKKY